MFDSRLVRLTILFLAIAAAYGASRQIRVTTDAHLNYAQTRALVLHGDVDLSRYGDQDGFVTRRHGRLYSVYGIGVSMLPAPLFAVLVRIGARPAALHAFGSIPFAAAAVIAMTLLLARLFGKTIAVGGMLVLGFGTTLWPVGTTAFWQQAQVVMLATLGLAAFFSDDRRAPFWAGLALGWSVFVRPPTAILFAAVGISYLFRPHRARTTVWYSAGAAPAALCAVVSNLWIWGTWIGGYGTAGVGFHGDVTRNTPRLVFGWWRGLLPYSPIFVLAILGAALAFARRRDPIAARMIVLAVSGIASIGFYARWTTWWGGANQFGYRYMLDAAPALVVLTAYAVWSFPRLRFPAAGLAVASIATMAAGSVSDRFWWDQSPRVFARTLGASPFGRAWAAVGSNPGPWLGRVALAAAVAVVAVWALRELPGLDPP